MSSREHAGLILGDDGELREETEAGVKFAGLSFQDKHKIQIEKTYFGSESFSFLSHVHWKRALVI